MSEATRFWVSGVVQGVFFRANTQQKARALGLTGWVRNLQDGRVEVWACGDAASLAALEKWLWQGPERARVEQVIAQAAKCSEADEYNDFQVL